LFRKSTSALRTNSPLSKPSEKSKSADVFTRQCSKRRNSTEISSENSASRKPKKPNLKSFEKSRNASKHPLFARPSARLSAKLIKLNAKLRKRQRKPHSRHFLRLSAKQSAKPKGKHPRDFVVRELLPRSLPN